MPRGYHIKLPWRPSRHLLTIAALQLLSAGSSWSLFPVMAPPLNVVINGEMKTLVVCVVNALAEEALGAVWFSNGNGSTLESFTYTVSGQEGDGFSTISQLAIHTEEFESWDAVTCYVTQNKTSRTWNTTSLQISEGSMEDSCLHESLGTQDQILATATQRVSSQVLLLLAIRMLLFKFLLTDVLMTCCILYKKEDPSSALKFIHPKSYLIVLQYMFTMDGTENNGLQEKDDLLNNPKHV